LYIDIDDVRDYQEGSYTLEWLADGSKLLFSKPAVPMFKWKKVSTIHQLEKPDEQDAKIMEQHKVVLTKLGTAPALNKLQTTYVFPNGVRVSNEAYNGTITGSGTKFEGHLG
jgi:hypothetical protein